MSGAIDTNRTIGVIGAGTMGAGIAQVAAAAGHRVRLFDVMENAAIKGKARIARDLDGLVNRGRMERGTADTLLARIEPAAGLDDLADVALAIEVIVENLDVKRDLLRKLEEMLAADAIIASNTSSISITSIARDAARPGQVVGMHFFNPAPVMKLVEIVSGVATAPEVADRIFATARAWGKVAVHARSTPGFIVNRVARPYYAEALRLYEEQVADPATIDALLTEGAGFRMGPFALMDLIGNDVNYAVTKSVFESYYGDPRFRPSIAQLELVNAGRLGRKTGRGFYDYAEGAAKPAPATEPAAEGTVPFPSLDIAGEMVIEGVLVARTDGRTAGQRAAAVGKPCVLLDLIAAEGAKRVGFAASSDVPDTVRARLVSTLAARGLAATVLPDWPGLVAMRTVAMLANEAFEAAMQGVASPDGIDDAMRFGVNYPQGPVAWARAIGIGTIVSALDAIHALTGDPRYRTSLGLRMAGQPD